MGVQPERDRQTRAASSGPLVGRVRRERPRAHRHDERERDADQRHRARRPRAADTCDADRVVRLPEPPGCEGRVPSRRAGRVPLGACVVIVAHRRKRARRRRWREQSHAARSTESRVQRASRRAAERAEASALRSSRIRCGGGARRLADADAGGLERLGLGGSRARRAGDDRARVSHGLALRRGETRDVADDRLGDVARR